MFLIGGPAFSGTTLLTLLLNQDGLVCLDEPDFHNPEQSHRGIPFLKSLYPGKMFPAQPERAIPYADAIHLIEACERVIQPHRLGIKTCDQVFISYAEIFKAKKDPVIAIIRDIRDALVRPLPPWINEAQLNRAYRLIWSHLTWFDLWFRYEELVTETDRVMEQIAFVLKQPLRPMRQWNADAVHHPMLKLDRHELLKSGTISRDRIGIWKTSVISFSQETLETAEMMGY
jgi:hypothetical protein